MLKGVGSSSSTSREGPLWVAAFCLKKLKKAQVFETDIPSSVDKILQDEMDVVSYRVLAYLLLGVVRIYSKKVEYLFDDCNEVLIKINKFVSTTKDNAQVETLRMSITIPDRLELDAFNLDILEDADSDGGHIATVEQITLKEVVYKTEGFAQFSQEKFEEFGFSGNTCSVDRLTVEECSVPQSHLMNMDFEVFSPNSSINLLASKDLFQNSIFSQKEPINLDTVLVVEGIEKESVNLFGQDRQINADQTVREIVPYENEIRQEGSRISQEEHMDISMFSRIGKEAVLSVEAFNESHQVDDERNIAKEAPSSLCQMHRNIIEVNDDRNSQESIERPRDAKSHRKESVDHAKSSVSKESLEELVEGYIEERDSEGKLEFQEKVSLEDGKLSVIPAESKNLDVTPQSKFQSGGSVGRPKPGATTPEFVLIPTPAAREFALFSRKRKFVFDEMTILPNEVLRKSISDASNLISNRRKSYHGRKQRESRISSLPDGFYESLLPCFSPELQFLFSKKKMKIPDSLEIVETLQKLDVLESQTVGSQEHIETAPQIPPRCQDSLVSDETTGKLDMFESQTYGSPEHMATAPTTPPLCQNVNARSIKHPDNLGPTSPLGPSSPHERIEREQYLERNEVLNLMEESNVETLNSYESLEREPCFNMDEDLDLMNEEINSCETENSKLLAGWSERTRKVAIYLHKSFLEQRKETEGNVLNFSQVSRGRTRKECARLFYEILLEYESRMQWTQGNLCQSSFALSIHYW